MGSIASASIKYGSKCTRDLLFRPPDLKFWLRWSLRLSAGDPRKAELDRLKPYYMGTMVLPAFLSPFMAPFVGFSGTLLLIVVYLALLILMSVAGMFLEVSLDAIFALRHETGSTLSGAVRTFARFASNRPGEALRYMGAKLLIDTGAMMVAMLFYLPSMFALIWLLSSAVHALEAGLTVGPMAFVGLALVAVLAVGAGIASMLISVPLSAFYGYYTEEAVRCIQA
jgi:hypothetical protein